MRFIDRILYELRIIGIAVGVVLGLALVAGFSYLIIAVLADLIFNIDMIPLIDLGSTNECR